MSNNTRAWGHMITILKVGLYARKCKLLQNNFADLNPPPLFLTVLIIRLYNMAKLLAEEEAVGKREDGNIICIFMEIPEAL